MTAATDLSGHVGIAPACAALGLPRASYYRHLVTAIWRPSMAPHPPGPAPLGL